MRILYACMGCLIFSGGYGQDSTLVTDTLVAGTSPAPSINARMDRYHALLRYHDPLMYLVFPVAEPVEDRTLPLENEEAENGYWLEGNFAYRFALYQGKYYSLPLFQRLRPTIDAQLTSRLTRDHSSPLLPLNNKIGVGIDFLLSGLDGLDREKGGAVWTTFQLHHYSNGQADSFFVEGPVQRNNYRSGDFSTNYWRGLLYFSGSGPKSIVTGSIGYQEDLDLGGPFRRSPELYHYYGEQRVLASFQITKQPRLVTTAQINRATASGEMIKVELRRQIMFRTELEYIVGDVRRWAGENEWRLGWHSYLTYMPSVTNEVGFLLHTYLGRDYLNIRFDDVVFVGAAGLFFKFTGR
jgi:hypothetical protein